MWTISKPSLYYERVYRQCAWLKQCKCLYTIIKIDNKILIFYVFLGTFDLAHNHLVYQTSSYRWNTVINEVSKKYFFTFIHVHSPLVTHTVPLHITFVQSQRHTLVWWRFWKKWLKPRFVTKNFYSDISRRSQMETTVCTQFNVFF